jgi:hypothetical protein
MHASLVMICADYCASQMGSQMLQLHSRSLPIMTECNWAPPERYWKKFVTAYYSRNVIRSVFLGVRLMRLVIIG